MYVFYYFWDFTSQDHDMITKEAKIEGSRNSDYSGSLNCADIAQHTGFNISPPLKCSHCSQNSIPQASDEQPNALATKPLWRGGVRFSNHG